MQNSVAETVSVPGELIDQLSRAYQALVDNCEQLKTLSDDDHRADFEVYVPPFSSTENERYSAQARKQAIVDAVGLTIDDTQSRQCDAGIVCASGETVSVVEQLNETKAHFKETILKIRSLASGKVAGSRETVLKKALKSAGIQTLDLRECYRQIRVMPPALESISWTWATSHARIQKLTFDEAVAMAEGLRDRDEDLAETALDILRRKCAPDEILVRRITLPNQLRANYSYLEKGEIQRKSCPISGAVIAQQKMLPRMAWRENPVSRKEVPIRLQRESKIEPEPVIQSLSIHRYVRGHA
ncbi:MAG: DNA replication terminus site-binding protein [Marinobacter sp.]|jgi:hypothetical protein|uniref:DNA replication terminus site-binding protein n=1 Tax=Marinobacter aromaticivorans TaxID=1494078 RepID=A0ABW2J0M1_9GAMM|nr:DNA replication terminus site-binding protein [Marinobacter aromaticivorans]GGE80491.1 hypothetical protein GCM10011533_36110 [Streptosporangium jomthongense]